MVDLHCHILPGIDDGAADTAQSEEMLRSMKEQGVSRVFLTPHFYPETISLEDYLSRRQVAFEYLGTSPVSLKLGAEVAYSRHLSRLGEIEKLCLEGTQYLLLELPFAASWENFILKDIQKMTANLDITFIIAHIEIYPAARRNFDFIKKLRDAGCLFQVDTHSIINAGFFDRLFLKKLYRHGCFHFLASDCHNMTERKPDLADGYIALQSILGKEASEIIKNNSSTI